MPKELTRKPCEKPPPYNRPPKQKVNKDIPKTSAKPKKQPGQELLTLSDWLTVFAFIDKYPHLSQGEVVKHFKEKVDGALEFTQSSLSQNLKRRKEHEERSKSTPMALSSKWVRVVTRPDVECALLLWTHHLEEIGETYTGVMLQEKWKCFEELFNVPEGECLSGPG
ncbi:hypothetical protein CPB84DRAFT_1639718, partial [Gymnopilus junonius]